MLSIETYMKELDPVYNESDLEYQETSIFFEFFRNPAMWESRNDTLQQKFFRYRFVLRHPGDTRAAKKLLKKSWGGEVSLNFFIVKPSSSFQNFLGYLG